MKVTIFQRITPKMGKWIKQIFLCPFPLLSGTPEKIELFSDNYSDRKAKFILFLATVFPIGYMLSQHSALFCRKQNKLCFELIFYTTKQLEVK